MLASAILCVDSAVFRDLFFVLVADGEQHGLGVDEIAALFAVVFEDARLDDGIDRAGFLAEAAEDALGEVDVVARGATGAVDALFRFDGNGERRTNRFAQLAGDAALLAVWVAAQRMQATEARRLRRFLLRELHGDLAREQVAPGEHHAAQKLDQEQAAEEMEDPSHGALSGRDNHTASASWPLPGRSRRA